MAVLTTKHNDEIILTCSCGCDDSVHLKITQEDDTFAFMAFLNGNYYRDQCSGFKLFTQKLRKIWAILTNKDYYYSDIILSAKDFEEFKKFVITDRNI